MRPLILSFIFLMVSPICNCQQAKGQAEFLTYPRVNVTTSGTAMMMITAVGRQTRIPIGIVLGTDYASLCRVSGSFDFSNTSALDALGKVADLAHYVITEENGTVLLTAPDVLPWQEDVLDHRFMNPPGFRNSTMANMGIQLTGWIQMDIARVPTYAYSLASSPDDLRLTLPPMDFPSTREVAEQIVLLDGGGIWMMKPLVESPKGAKDVVITMMSYRDRPDTSAVMGCSPGD